MQLMDRIALKGHGRSGEALKLSHCLQRNRRDAFRSVRARSRLTSTIPAPTILVARVADGKQVLSWLLPLLRLN